MNSRWYRLCVVYSSLVWLNTLCIVTSVGIVTIPAAMTAAHDQAGRLVREGLTPTWRGFLASIRTHGTTSTLVMGVLAIPTLAAGVVLTKAQSAIAIGAAAAAGLVLLLLLTMSPYIVSVSCGGPRGGLTRTVAAVVLRPGAALASLGAWTAVGAAACLAPLGVAVPLYAVAVALPTYLTTLIAHRAGRPRRDATPRSAAARLVLSPSGAGATESVTAG